MAIIKNIPQQYQKEVITKISFEGLELDLYSGSIVMGSIDRECDASGDSTAPYSYSNGKTEAFDLAQELADNVTIDGITAQQVFAWLSKWTDYKKGEYTP